MLISVVIPTKNRPHTIVDAVRSIFQGTYQQFELFVVDQTADDATHNALKPFMADPRFHYVLNREAGYGTSRSRNIGIALSSGEVVAMTDDDVEVRPDWLDRIAAEFTADSELEFLCGSLLAPPFDPAQGFIPHFIPSPNLKKWQLPLHAANANMSMRRTIFERIGGYDELCGPGGILRSSDDGDISFRILRSGAKWKVCPDIAVVHTHGYRPIEKWQCLSFDYQYGNGAIFGRFMRRGDIFAGAWFFLREARTLARIMLRSMRGHAHNDIKDVVTRLRGFWHGFRLPPYKGFISGEQMLQLRMYRPSQRG